MAINSTDTSFSDDVIKQSGKIPVLVDFWALWCPPCLAFSPNIEEAVEHPDVKGKVVLVKVDTSECPKLSEKYGISSIPAVKLFKKGKIVAEFVGLKSVETVVEWLKAKL
jgi:putative thioredoxin